MSTEQLSEPLLPPKGDKRPAGAPIDFDYCLPHRQSDHSQHVTVAALKSERLAVKNQRRAKMGLPPIQ